MEPIRYIHAADLHLDAPFTGVARLDPWLGQRLRNATFAALERLTRLCIDKRPDFLVLAGDLYNQEEHSIQAQLKLREACIELERHNIPVYIVRGNHDPLSSQLAAVNLPDNTYVFGATPTHQILEKPDGSRAIVHGVSHAHSPEPGNLAKLLKRLPTENAFQLGVLHCDLDGAADAGKYAPCALADLIDTGLDAFALGHVHKRRIVSSSPFIAYPGNIQGLHHGETGAKGCLLVKAISTPDGWVCEPEFYPLAPVRWESKIVNVEGCEKLDEIESKLIEALPEPGGISETDIILDIKAVGRTALHNQLSTEEASEEFIKVAKNATSAYVRKICFDTSPPVAGKDNLERDDLLGEIARVCEQMQQNPDILAKVLETATAPLRKGARGLLMDESAPESLTLLRSAQRICQDMLEER